MKYVIDSGYALHRLLAKAPLDLYESSLTIAQGCGPAHYGLMYEALVHKLFYVPNMCVTFHVRSYSLSGASSNAYQDIVLGTNMDVECSGTDETKAMNCLCKIKIGTDRSSYWHPDFPRFPVVDAVLFIRETKTVLYIQKTVGKEHNISREKLDVVHDAAKTALESSTDANGWEFKYVAVAPYQVLAEALILKEGGRVLSACTMGEVTISKGYETHAA